MTAIRMISRTTGLRGIAGWPSRWILPLVASVVLPALFGFLRISVPSLVRPNSNGCFR